MVPKKLDIIPQSILKAAHLFGRINHGAQPLLLVRTFQKSGNSPPFRPRAHRERVRITVFTKQLFLGREPREIEIVRSSSPTTFFLQNYITAVCTFAFPVGF